MGVIDKVEIINEGLSQFFYVCFRNILDITKKLNMFNKTQFLEAAVALKTTLYL